MGKILNVVEKYSGGKCFPAYRVNLDDIIPHEYQDKDEKFNTSRIFETDNRIGKKRSLTQFKPGSSIFKYFLDGSRKTYKVVDFASTDGKYLPIVAGQVGTAVCFRYGKKINKFRLSKFNIVALPDRMGDEFESIRKEIGSISQNNIVVNRVVEYKHQTNQERPPENLAIAKIQKEMLDEEINLIDKMVTSNILKTDQILIIDGSLQYTNITQEQEYIFHNVIGISKSFNPNLQGILKTRGKEIGNYLTSLNYGERTPIYKYESQSGRKFTTVIGAWYLRIREKKYTKGPLEGIIKIEKIAVTEKEKQEGFQSELIDEISAAILQERNVTCHGKDDRWANHLYPIYLTELFIKSNFVSDKQFLSIF
jgi:hypothetical protein